MLRLIGILLLLAVPAWGVELPSAEPLHPSPNFRLTGPKRLRGEMTAPRPAQLNNGVMPGEGTIATDSPGPEQQVVDTGPSPGMTAGRGKGVAPGDPVSAQQTRGAKGALVWLHGSYDTDTQPNPPPEPGWIARLARQGFDIWRFDRTPGHDPLAPGGEALARGLTALRNGGYRDIVVAGHSRGAWIALTALAHTGLADAVIAVSPAAHGTRPERRAQAMADWTALWHAAAPGTTRVVLVQLADDPLDPDPPRRRAIASDAATRAGFHLLSVYLPASPRGHLGAYEPDFDRLLAPSIVAFVDQPPATRSAGLPPAPR